MKYPDDIRYLVIRFNYISTELEFLYNSREEFVSGYCEGEDDPILFPKFLDKHTLTPDGSAMVLDLMTGRIVNWMPPDEEKIEAFLSDMEVIKYEQEFWEAAE